MSKKRSKPQNTPRDELRRQAEARLVSQVIDMSEMRPEQIRELVHELRVHQVELEIQNEQLRSAQLELAEAKDRYLDLYEFAPVGYVTLDRHRVIRSANLAAATILNADRQRLVGARFATFLLSEDHDTCYLHLNEAAARDDQVGAEVRIRRADGELTYVHLETSPIGESADAFEGWRVTLHDVTERKRDEQALRQSEQTFRSIGDLIPFGVWICHPDGGVAYLSQSFLDMLGMTLEEAREFGWLGRYAPGDKQKMLQAWRRCREDGSTWEYEHRLRDRDGQWRAVLSRGFPMRDSTGRITQWVGLNLDITDRKQAEEALRRANESLEQRVAERTAEQQLLSDAATAANEAESLDEAIAYVLQRVSEHNGWAFGHAYLPDPEDPEMLIPAKTYYEGAPRRFQWFRRLTRDLRLRRGQGLPGRVYARGEPEWSNDLAADLLERRADLGEDIGLHCAAGFPIRAGHETVGVLEFFADHEIEPSERIVETMTAIGTQIGRVVERDRFGKQISAALLAQQRNIASTLHDTVSQQLVGTALSLERIVQRLEAEDRPEADTLRRLADAVREAQRSAQRTSRGLFPVGGEPGALKAALHDLVESIQHVRGDIGCTFESDGSLDPPDADAAAHLYYIVSEAVANALRHASPKQITVRGRREDHRLILEVADDGNGMPETSGPPQGVGLRIMRYRATLIGANLEVLPAPTGGTRIRCTLELE